MRHFIIAAVLALSASAAAAQSIDMSTEFAWKNGPARDSRYKLGEHLNTVHVFEAYALFCSWCNRNAAQVEAMAELYKDDDRVQFIDLGQDTSDRDYQSWISQHHPSYPVVQDPDRIIFDALASTSGIPQTFVVDCNGQLVGATVGYWGDEEKQTIKDAIAQAKETSCN